MKCMKADAIITAEEAVSAILSSDRWDCCAVSAEKAGRQRTRITGSATTAAESGRHDAGRTLDKGNESRSGSRVSSDAGALFLYRRVSDAGVRALYRGISRAMRGFRGAYLQGACPGVGGGCAAADNGCGLVRAVYRTARIDKSAPARYGSTGRNGSIFSVGGSGEGCN